jgi:Rod binding domain-containing protein
MTRIADIAANTKVDSMPRAGKPQVSRDMGAISALPRTGHDSSPTPDSKLNETAQKLVANTFYGTLLKQMHDSPFKSDLFSGGRGEEAFSPLYDQQMAQRMAAGAGQKLVKSIVKKFHKQAEAAYAKQKKEGFLNANRRP